MNTRYTPGLVSMILPVYNAAPYLPRALDSVLQQTFPHWELLIVDDGSTDESHPICTAYARQDQRIHLHRIDHTGVSGARNYGLSAAQGEWIFFLDSDDWLPENALEALLSHAADADIIMGSYPEMPASIHTIISPQRYDLQHISAEAKNELYFLRLFQTVWNKLYRHDRITSAFRTDLFYGEDTAFNFAQLPNWQTAVIIPDHTYHYAARAGSLTYQLRADRMQHVQLVFDLFDAYFMDCDEAMDAVSCWYAAELYRYFYVCVRSPKLPASLSQLMIEAWLSDPAFKPDRIHAHALSGPASELWSCVLKHDTAQILELLKPSLSEIPTTCPEDTFP